MIEEPAELAELMAQHDVGRPPLGLLELMLDGEQPRRDIAGHGRPRHTLDGGMRNVQRRQARLDWPGFKKVHHGGTEDTEKNFPLDCFVGFASSQ